MNHLLGKIKQGIELLSEEAVNLLEIELFSSEYYSLIEAANTYARKTFKNKGLIFGQIGMDASPCSVNCKFCQLAVDNFNDTSSKVMKTEQIISEVKELVNEGANEIFLMSTAQIDKDYFLEVGAKVREVIPADMRMVANTGDFDAKYAKELVKAGFTGVYHICRLGEEEDTSAELKIRINTLDAIKGANLELYYCVEPIGPEHTNEQIATEIFRAKDYGVNVMAVMRRVNFEGSPMQELGEITAARMALICAVSVLCVRPNRAMGVHEPEIISLISGANQIYAEMGTNPRDTDENTQNNRGFSVTKAKRMLSDANWSI